jgi:hypothetical protein
MLVLGGKALREQPQSSHQRGHHDRTNSPRVINVDGHPEYPQVIADLERAGELGRSCPLPACAFLDNTSSRPLHQKADRW